MSNRQNVIITDPDRQYKPYTAANPMPVSAAFDTSGLATEAKQDSNISKLNDINSFQLDTVTTTGADIPISAGLTTGAIYAKNGTNFKAVTCNTEGEVRVDTAGNGLSTADKQDDVIGELQTNNALTTTISSAVTSVDGKITVGSDDTLSTAQQVLTYGRKDATPSGLRAIKTDTEGRLKVDIDADSVGLATEATLSNIDTKITAGDDDTLTTAQQVAIYARKDTTPTGLRALKASDDGTLHTFDGGLNTKITCGADASLSLATQVLNYGRFANDGTLKAMKVTSDGSIITAPAGGTIITSDGTTSEQRVMILGNHNGNLRTIKCGDAGALSTEIDHDWTNTDILFNAQTIAAGANATSTTFDLGQGISHEVGSVEFFLTNSATVDVEVVPQVSYNGSQWYGLSNGFSIFTTQQYVAYSQEDIGIGKGHRYMRFVVTNNDISLSTDITLNVGYYK